MEKFVFYTIVIILNCWKSGNCVSCDGEVFPIQKRSVCTGESCGLCDCSYSPQLACSYTGICCRCLGPHREPMICPEDADRVEYYLCPKKRCCTGDLHGSYCYVSGCGGEEDKMVKNQPACYRQVKKLRYVIKRTYTCCGWFCWQRCPRYQKECEEYYERGDPYCASGFTLSGSRCIK